MRKWTKEENAVLKDNWDLGSKKLSEILNRTVTSIFTHRKAMGWTAKNGDTESARLECRQKARIRGDRYRSRLTPEKQEKIKQYTRDFCKKEQQKRSADGVCLDCGGKLMDHSKRSCLRCWARCSGVTCGHKDYTFGDKLIAKLEEQHYKCAITKQPLFPGLNASIDHINPRSKGGSLDDLSNLQWVELRINLAKRNLSMDEFISMCKDVVQQSSII